MTIFPVADLAGALTMATPSIFPILPFILASADVPFRRGGLPILLGVTFSFAVEPNRRCRAAALAAMLPPRNRPAGDLVR